MVIDHIEDHADSGAVRVVHKTAEIVGRAINRHGSEPADAIVAPSEAAGEIGNRHDLDHGYADGGQLGQFTPRGFPGALGA